MHSDRIKAYFENRLDDMLEDISRLVAIRSVRGEAAAGLPFGEGPKLALDAAMDIAGRMGYKTKNVDNYAMHIDLNSEPAVLGILAHLDVVEEGEGWTLPPYEMTVEGGKMYGRGVMDNKGPAIAALYAMDCARSIEPGLKGVRLVLGCAEETGNECLAYYRGQEELPHDLFTPDALFPVINIEKGHYRPQFGADWDEDSSLPRVVSLAGGKTPNIVPARAHAVLEGIGPAAVAQAAEKTQAETGVEFIIAESGGLVEIEARGAGAHASTPDMGKNAQTALIRLICALPLADSRQSEVIRLLDRIFPFGDTAGKAAGMACRDELSGPLTLNFGVLDMGLTGFKAQIDSRAPICANEENTSQPFTALMNSHGIEITGSRRMTPPHHTPAEGEMIRVLNETYEKYTGLEGGCLSMGGGTYAHGITGGVAFGCGLPGGEYNVHGADEFFPLSELVTCAQMFAEVILRLCGR